MKKFIFSDVIGEPKKLNTFMQDLLVQTDFF